MEQNTIAVIWDFDKTLIPGYMQDPLFVKYGVDSKKFWNETNSLFGYYKEKGINVNKDTIYLNHILTCVKQEIFKGLSNSLLQELGKEIVFCPGVPGVFQKLRDEIASKNEYKLSGIHVENYIVSTGLTAMIRGALPGEIVDGIWGCEFIENPKRSSLDIRIDEEKNQPPIISQIGYMIDNTSKTRAIFEINKGSNKLKDINVNAKMNHKDRRVPIENMIYIADGPSDVPVFSVIKQYGGRALAVYQEKNSKSFEQANNLLHDGRVDYFALADYSEGSAAYQWLSLTINKIAQRMYKEWNESIKKEIGSVPEHIV